MDEQLQSILNQAMGAKTNASPDPLKEILQGAGIGNPQANSPTTILPSPTQITQHFGNYNPDLEVFSGGIARDTNFATQPETPVTMPEGEWQVIKAYNQAAARGYPGNSDNDGYGNAVMVQNRKTGDKLHLIHLSSVSVQPGEILNGGQSIGSTGSSGNATGPNLGVEYYDPQGNLQDVMASPYAKYLPVKQGSNGGSGGGGGSPIIPNDLGDQIGATIGNGIGAVADFIGNGIHNLLNPPQIKSPIQAVKGAASQVAQTIMQPKQIAKAQAGLPAIPTVTPTPSLQVSPKLQDLTQKIAQGFINYGRPEAAQYAPYFAQAGMNLPDPYMPATLSLKETSGGKSLYHKNNWLNIGPEIDYPDVKTNVLGGGANNQKGFAGVMHSGLYDKYLKSGNLNDFFQTYTPHTYKNADGSTGYNGTYDQQIQQYNQLRSNFTNN